MCTTPCSRTHGANKFSLFARILDQHEVTLLKFVQTKVALIAYPD